jgi:hypothetical protein
MYSDKDVVNGCGIFAFMNSFAIYHLTKFVSVFEYLLPKCFAKQGSLDAQKRVAIKIHARITWMHCVYSALLSV